MSTSMNSPTSSAARQQAPVVKPRQCLTGDLAEAFSAYVVSLYVEPEPMAIRAICEKTGRSYGNIHRILTDAKVTMRNRGYRGPSGLEKHRDDDE
ncbi:helix-turn-helix domain-containing protein [Streptomyces lydicus]|uniref:helix-turn-helix domain-containing protein n=1 Tax=Streptomyces lydicus TaxID=47763 RepID=UPI0037036962